MVALNEAFTANAANVAGIGAAYTWTANNTGFGSNASGRVTQTSTAERVAVPNVPLASNEHWAEVVVHGFSAGPTVRAQSTSSFSAYHARLESLSQIRIYRWFGTFLVGFPVAVSLPGTLRLQVEDSAGPGSNPVLEVFWNGVSAGTYTDTDALNKITTGNYAGIYTSDTTAILDDFAAADLAVATAPGAPTIGTATAGDSQATANWTAPASDGGSAITGYKIDRTVNGGGFAALVANTGSTATTYVDSTAVNGTAYTYRVQAINAIGTGTASAASNSVTPAAAADVTPPVVTLASIHGADQVADIYDSAGYNPTTDDLIITITATDAESAVTAVEVSVDGAAWVAATFGTGNDWIYVIDVTPWDTGNHTINARATSEGGTIDVGAVTVRHNPSGIYLRSVTPGGPCPPAELEIR